MIPPLVKMSLLAVMFSLFTQTLISQVEVPQASPRGKVEQRVGVMDVSISYSRPGIKGRRIFGGLVPYGEEWRTGANARTTISFSDSVKVEGHPVPAGTYSLFTIPGEEEWTIILNRQTSGGVKRDPREDVVKFKVKSMLTGTPIETFTIDIADITTNTANVMLAWENTVVKFRMAFDVDAKVMAEIKKSMENPLAGAASTYYQSASYYFTTNKDLKTALEWVNKSIEINDKPFTVWRLKSQIQAGLGDYKGAIASAEISKAKALEAGNEQFVKYNEDAIATWSSRE